ncbi:MAG: DUF4388 domain-containing protein [Chloroflexota bacterium]
MAMQGLLRDMGVPELIQHVCQEGKTARLVVENMGEQAELFFAGGQVVHAQFGPQEGEPAVYAILDWKDGSFLLEPDVSAPRQTIDRSYAGLLLEGARRIDEGPVPASSPTQTPSTGSGEGGGMNETAQALAKIEGVEGSVLVAEDGVVLAQALQGDAEKEGAVAAFVGAAAQQASQALGLGPFRKAMVTGGAGTVVILRQQDYYVGLLLKEGASPALAASRAEAILSGGS